MIVMVAELLKSHLILFLKKISEHMLKLCIAANLAAAETSTAFSSPLSDDLNGFFYCYTDLTNINIAIGYMLVLQNKFPLEM